MALVPSFGQCLQPVFEPGTQFSVVAAQRLHCFAHVLTPRIEPDGQAKATMPAPIPRRPENRYDHRNRSGAKAAAIDSTPSAIANTPNKGHQERTRSSRAIRTPRRPMGMALWKTINLNL
jgi:hypothetical protein